MTTSTRSSPGMVSFFFKPRFFSNFEIIGQFSPLFLRHSILQTMNGDIQTVWLTWPFTSIVNKNFTIAVVLPGLILSNTVGPLNSKFFLILCTNVSLFLI